MEPLRNREGVLWGLPLVAIGILLLLRNLGLVGSVWSLFWAALYGAGGLLFLATFQRHKETGWWALIPAFTLFGLAAKGAMQWASPWLGRHFGEAVFLASTGIGFGLIYTQRREHWWPLIPAGVLLSLAVQKSAASFLSFRMGDILWPIALIALGVYLIVQRLPGRGSRQ